jgi:hypothetical protein
MKQVQRRPSKFVLKATGVFLAVKTQVIHKRERTQRLDKLLAGISGGQLRKLLGPLLRRKLRQLRQRKEIQAHPPLTDADFSRLADFCVANSVLSVLGRDSVLRLVKSATIEAMMAGDFLRYHGEPSYSANIQLVFSGTAAVRHRSDEHSIQLTGAIDSKMFRFEFVGAGEPLTAPFICGALTVLIDATSPYSVLASTPLLFLNVKASDVANELRSCDEKVVLRLRGSILAHRLAFFSTRYLPAPLILRHGWLSTIIMLMSGSKRHPGITPLQALQSRMTPRCYLPGEPLVAAGKLFEGIIFLWRGEAEGHFSPSLPLPQGTEPQSMKIVPLTVIGERSICLGYRSKHTILAKTTCDAWFLPAEEYEFLKMFIPGFREKVEGVGRSIQQQLLMRKHDQEVEALASLPVPVKPRAPPAILLSSAPALSPTPAVASVGTARSPLLSFISLALRAGVPYLQDAPETLLRDLACSATPAVHMQQTALLTRSRWSHKMVLISKGVASYQLGRNPTTADLAMLQLTRGTVLGAECVVEHRSVVSVCSMSVLEVWCIDRGVVREHLRQHGLLDTAEAWSRRHILALYGRLETDPPDYLLHRAEYRASAGKAPTGSPRKPQQQRVTHGESDGHKQPPPVVDDGAGSVLHTATIGVGKPFVFCPSSGDLDLGLVNSASAIRLLCSSPTVDHVRFASLFPEVTAMIKECGESGVQLLEPPAIAEIQSLSNIEPVMSIFQRDSDDSSESSDFYDGNGENSRADRRSIVTFVPGKCRPRSESAIEFLAETKREEQEKGSEKYVLVHRRATTFLVAEMAELVGERAPWHVLLLERKCNIPGMLDASEPLPGTTVVRKRIRPFVPKAAQRKSSEQELHASPSGTMVGVPDLNASVEEQKPQEGGIGEASSHHGRPAGVSGPAAAPLAASPSAGAAVAPLPVGGRRPQQHMFHPINPHGYACVLPRVVENPRAKKAQPQTGHLQHHQHVEGSAPEQWELLKSIVEGNPEVVRQFYRQANAGSGPGAQQQMPPDTSDAAVDFDEIFMAEVTKSVRSQSMVYEAHVKHHQEEQQQQLTRAGGKGNMATGSTSAAVRNTAAHRSLLASTRSPGEEVVPPPESFLNPISVSSSPHHNHAHSPKRPKRSYFLDEYERFLFSAMRAKGADDNHSHRVGAGVNGPRAPPGGVPRKVWRPNSCNNVKLACTTSVHELITGNQKAHLTRSTLVLPSPQAADQTHQQVRDAKH